MGKTNRFARRVLLLLLAFAMILQPLVAMAEESTDVEAEDAITHIAIATTALKVRREPDKDSRGIDSIKKGAYVYILELTNDDWVYVKSEHTKGYVQTQYLDKLTEFNGTISFAASEPEVISADNFTADTSVFRDAYQAYAVKEAGIYQEANEKSRWLQTVHTYKKVYVSVVDGDWCYARQDNVYGFMRCKDLFKWDRLVPDAGEIPGLDIMPLMVFVKNTTNIYSVEDNSLLKTVNAGSALATFEKDDLGRYTLPYWRTVGYVNAEDVAYVMEVAPDYTTAQPGELLSVMSTYYAVGVSTLQFQGRNWNIHLASSMISGTILQVGESYDQYQVIGPYRKSTGYHRAPVMRTGVLSGYGGGTCQVNTTFYITNIQLPILVTHRKVHADVGIYYAKKGFDAAVGGGDINLTLINTMPYPIRYQFFDSDGVLTCAIFRES